MTSDGISILGIIFTTVWHLFVSWYIPGTGITPAMAFIGIAVCSLSLRFFLSLGSLGPSLGAASRSVASKPINDKVAYARGEQAMSARMFERFNSSKRRR